jgi:formate/nitrite transporter FocA (FNT family)
MYIAVDTFNTQSQDKNCSATLLTVLCVSVFILSNFEHSVADMFYFMLALPVDQWILPLLIITFGNILGGNIFCYLNKQLKEAP